MADAHAGLTAQATWAGGGSPFAVGHKKLGMWLFIVSDALTFGALLVAYCYVRNANDWPTPFDFFPAIIFSSVMTLVLRQGLKVAVVGLVLGTVGALALNRFIESLLFGVSSRDPATFVAVPLVLGVVAVAACFIPARRATRVDPMVVLRAD